jgi:hypothetical protein
MNLVFRNLFFAQLIFSKVFTMRPHKMPFIPRADTTDIHYGAGDRERKGLTAATSQLRHKLGLSNNAIFRQPRYLWSFFAFRARSMLLAHRGKREADDLPCFQPVHSKQKSHRLRSQVSSFVELSVEVDTFCTESIPKTELRLRIRWITQRPTASHK